MVFVVQKNSKHKQEMVTMTTIQPEGENLRKAVQWISDERKYGPKKKPVLLIEEACLKFNLTPADAEYLLNFVKQGQ